MYFTSIMGMNGRNYGTNPQPIPTVGLRAFRSTVHGQAKSVSYVVNTWKRTYTLLFIG